MYGVKSFVQGMKNAYGPHFVSNDIEIAAVPSAIFCYGMSYMFSTRPNAAKELPILGEPWFWAAIGTVASVLAIDCRFFNSRLQGYLLGFPEEIWDKKYRHLSDGELSEMISEKDKQ